MSKESEAAKAVLRGKIVAECARIASQCWWYYTDTELTDAVKQRIKVFLDRNLPADLSDRVLREYTAKSPVQEAQDDEPMPEDYGVVIECADEADEETAREEDGEEEAGGGL